MIDDDMSKTSPGSRLGNALLTDETPTAAWRAVKVKIAVIAEFERTRDIEAAATVAAEALERSYEARRLLELAIEGDKLDREELRVLVEEAHRAAEVESAVMGGFETGIEEGE